MTDVERHARRLLRLYPARYRERRGEELVSTLVDASGDRSRVSMRDSVNVARHAGGMRLSRLHPLPLVVAVALLASTVVLAYQEAQSRRTTYVDTAILLVGGPRQRAFSPTELATYRAMLLAGPVLSRAEAAEGLNLSCTVGKGVVSRSLAVTCTSLHPPQSNTSRQLVAAFELELRHTSLDRFVMESQLVQAQRSLLGRQIELTTRQLDHLQRTSPLYPIYARTLARQTLKAQQLNALEQVIVRRLFDPVSSPFSILSFTSAQQPGASVSVLDVALAGAIGAVLALAWSTVRDRRRPLRPA